MHIHSRRAPPNPRRGVYELYWAFASRRQAAFERRLAGADRPWSDDRIIEAFKFCNVYRAADRVSQYMIRNVAYASDRSSYADRLFQIVAFRTFSNIATWEGVRTRLGGAPTLADLRSGRFERALDAVRACRGRLYTGAFILCANKAYGHAEKHRNHVALFGHMFGEGRLDENIREANSLQAVVRTIEAFPLMGPFMAYQTAIDLNYSELVHFDEDDHTQAGPGAIRGLRKAFHDLGDHTPSDAIMWMVDRQDEEFARLGLPFAGLFGRRLHAIDCQGLFCELDKYCREAVPDLTSNRSRIKSRFTPSSDPLTLYFPSKWNIAVGDRVVPASIDTSEAQGRLDLGRSIPPSPRSPPATRSRRPLVDDRPGSPSP